MSSVLRLRDISFAYGDRAILSSLSFEMAAGQLVALIGTNGSGKTTLLRIILGELAASHGVVERAGTSRRQAVGYVPQHIAFDRNAPIRVRDFVALGVDGHRLGIRRRRNNVADTVDRVLASVDADHLAERRLGRLSGGEQQRVLVAHALAGRPQLMLLDEPFANLDPAATDEIAALLDQVAHRHGVAVVITAHDMNPLLNYLDQVVYLVGGRAVSGTVDEVVRGEVLTSLYGHHVDVVRVHGRIVVVSGGGETDDVHDVVVE